MNAIITDRLTKSYDHTTNALDSLTITVPEGKACALLGPDGAGKTTVVKLLGGLITPSSGRCMVMEIDPEKNPARLHSVCGVVTPSAHLYGCMTGRENLAFFGETAGMTASDAQVRAAELMKDLGIWQARETLVRDFPSGVMQRLSLARALMIHPKVLLLDEPFQGLDPESTQAVLGLLTGLKQQEGLTILLCTHHPAYAQLLCTQFGILREGVILAAGGTKELCRKAECSIRAGVCLPEQDSLTGFIKGADGFWQKQIEKESDMPDLLREIVAAGHDVYEAHLYRPTLADAYTALLEKEESR
ncbi:ABC transporter ATP-binding protein [Caproicibacterium sp. XB2]|jgi:ABC-2 type transport system ATP-binding protein|uniref:ABC transporter ATP-binding protein n=1 Tax=Caproicibacterium TaxID=2834348 RepID=UPI00384CD72D